jgi:hypothetical protein
MKHVFGLRRRGDSAMLLRGHNGRSVRQHLKGLHNHMARRYHCGGALMSKDVMPAPTPAKVDKILAKANPKSYVPLKFKI